MAPAPGAARARRSSVEYRRSVSPIRTPHAYAPDPQRAPRMASDVARGVIALGPAAAVCVLAVLGYAALGRAPVAELFAVGVFVFWAAYGASLIALTFAAFARPDADELGRRLRSTAPPAGRWRRASWAMLGGGAVSWAVTGSVAAVTAVVALALRPDVAASPFVTWSAVAAVAASWALTVNAYAVRIAREAAVRGGLEFPGESAPRFTEYVYLAVQLSTTFSSSDVAVTSSRMRRIVTGDSLVSFVFNTVIVALLVSVLVTRIG